MDVPYNLISTISPAKGEKIDKFDKHSKYVVKISEPNDLAETLYKYAENFFEALNNILDGIDSEFNSMSEIKAEMEAEYYAEMLAERDYY